VSKVPGPEYGLNEIIDALTQQVIEGRSENKYNPIRPSSSGKCERELGYEFMEFRGHMKYPREQNTSSTHRLLNFGHHVERHTIDEIYQAIKQSKTKIDIKYKQQTLSFFKLPDGSWLEGNMDLGIESDGWKIAVDVKSKGDKYSQFFKSSWDEFVEKLERTGAAQRFGDDAIFITDLVKFIDSEQDVWFNNNLYQLNFYLGSEFLRDRGYNLGAILQYNKNDSRLREIRFEFSQELFDRVKDKFTKVVSLVDRDKSAEGLNKDYTLGSSKCGFCPFKQQCWPENDALKEYFNTLPPKQWPKDLDRLPKEVQAELDPLFKQYLLLSDTPAEIEKLEEKIVGILDKNKVYKVRLESGQIYRVKRLKSGGAGGGERYVLRRDKL
jgi:hypothetical protein